MGVIDTTAQANLDQRSASAPFAGELFIDPILNCECQFCWGKPVIAEIRDRIVARLDVRLRRGDEPSNDALAALRMLARSREPIQGKVFAERLGRDERQVKQLMRELRDDWQMPVVAMRERPYGYFIAATAKEFLEWMRTTRNQAISELATAHRLFKTNFPDLAGQQSLDFIQTVSSELQEAIR